MPTVHGIPCLLRSQDIFRRDAVPSARSAGFHLVCQMFRNRGAGFVGSCILDKMKAVLSSTGVNQG